MEAVGRPPLIGGAAHWHTQTKWRDSRAEAAAAVDRKDRLPRSGWEREPKLRMKLCLGNEGLKGSSHSPTDFWVRLVRLAPQGELRSERMSASSRHHPLAVSPISSPYFQISLPTIFIVKWLWNTGSEVKFDVLLSLVSKIKKTSRKKADLLALCKLQ